MNPVARNDRRAVAIRHGAAIRRAIASHRAPLALALAAGLALPAHAGVVTAHWLNPVSGNWTDASNWSSSPHYPDILSPPGVAYHAIIGAVGANYNVQLNGIVHIDQFTLNSANATFNLTGGAFSATNNMNLLAGAFALAGGTIYDAAILNTGADFHAAAGTTSTLYNTALSGALNLRNGSTVNVQEGLTLDNATVSLASSDAQTSFIYNGPSTIGGTATIVFNGSSSNNTVRTNSSANSLTIGAGVTIRTGSQGGTIGQSGGALTNYGVVSAETPGRTLTIAGSNVVNHGLFRAAAGTLRLTGSYNLDTLGQIQTTGDGVLMLSGTLNMNGGELTLNNSDKRLTLNAATVRAGTLAAEQGGMLLMSGFSTLESVTLRADHDLNFTIFSVRDRLTLDDSRLVARRIGLVNSSLIDGNGVITLVDPSFSSAFIATADAGRALTIGPAVTVRTNGVEATIGRTDTYFENNGALVSEHAGDALIVRGQNWVNNGVLRAIDGRLRLEGTMSGGLGQYETIGSGEIELATNINFNGDTLHLTDAASRLTVASGVTLSNATFALSGDSSLNFRGASTILNSLIQTDDDAAITVFSGTPHFQNTSFGSGQVVINGPGGIRFNAGLTLDGTNIILNNSGLLLGGSQPTLAGPGEVVFSGSDGDSFLRSHSATGAFTIGHDVTVRTGDRGGDVGRSTAPITNNGALSSETAGRVLRLLGSSIVNNGLLRATDGALRVEGALTTANLGQFEAIGPGVIELAVNLNNAGATLQLDNAARRLTLDGSTITSGVVAASNGGALILKPNATNTFTNVTLNADLVVDNSTLRLNGTTTLGDATISITNNGSITPVVDLILNGTGSVVFDGAGSIQSLSNATLTVGEGVDVRNGAGNGLIGTHTSVLVNNGALVAPTPNRSITITTAATNNIGLLHASGGLLIINSPMSVHPSGVVRADNGGAIFVGAPLFTNAGLIEARAGGAVRIDAVQTLSMTGALLAGRGGLIEFTNASGLALQPSSSLTFELAGLTTADYGRVAITGDAALSGELGIVLTDAFAPVWGDSWEVLTYGSRTGDFSLITTPTLADPNLAWWTDAGATAYTVGVRHIADINNDNVIDFEDFSVVLAEYGMSGSSLSGDLNNDGVVDFADFSIVLANYGAVATGSLASAAVPAPGAAAALALAALGLARRRR